MPLVILHHLLDVSVQLANKRGFKQKNHYVCIFMYVARQRQGKKVNAARIIRNKIVYTAFLNISPPYRPPWPTMGIALLYGDGVCFL
jgi:hypothetical protein